MPAMRAMFVVLYFDRLTLTLLVARIGTDHSHHAFAADDLAIAAHLLDRRCDFHASLL